MSSVPTQEISQAPQNQHSVIQLNVLFSTRMYGHNVNQGQASFQGMFTSLCIKEQPHHIIMTLLFCNILTVNDIKNLVPKGLNQTYHELLMNLFFQHFSE